jgi:hypothetical protein
MRLNASQSPVRLRATSCVSLYSSAVILFVIILQEMSRNNQIGDRESYWR